MNTWGVNCDRSISCTGLQYGNFRIPILLSYRTSIWKFQNSYIAILQDLNMEISEFLYCNLTGLEYGSFKIPILISYRTWIWKFQNSYVAILRTWIWKFQNSYIAILQDLSMEVSEFLYPRCNCARVSRHRSTCTVVNSDLPVPIHTQSHQLSFHPCHLQTLWCHPPTTSAVNTKRHTN